MEGGDIPGYQYNNVSTKVEFCPVPQHPIYQFSVNPEKRRGWMYPNIKFNIFIRYCFDVEPDCGDCSHRLIEFEFVQYGCDLVFFLIIRKNIGEGRGMGG